ncbi:hypothetical protein ElyMa_003248400 [Elysia marginata]|uniref:Uncharacterized protein n=1 Tax=Elysia marginata TaxID=1093978 RepID=A0AAV4J4V4_9GAST|nr:hypothetical protein ElyMa_003248400 [Elysia marginata]
MKPMQKLRRMFALGADSRHQNSSPTECENLYSAGASVLNAMVTMLKNDSPSDSGTKPSKTSKRIPVVFASLWGSAAAWPSGLDIGLKIRQLRVRFPTTTTIVIVLGKQLIPTFLRPPTYKMGTG